MTIERETMSAAEYAEFLAYGSEDGCTESPIPGEFIKDEDGKVWFVSGGSQCVGCAFCMWHSDMDAVYAVGSSTIANVGIGCDILQAAVDLLKRINLFDCEHDKVERDWLVTLSEAAIAAKPSESLQMVYE